MNEQSPTKINQGPHSLPDPATGKHCASDVARTTRCLSDGQSVCRGQSTAGSKKDMSYWLDLMDAQLRQAYLESTRALVATVEAKDCFTKQHSARVSRFSRQIALRLGLSRADVVSIVTAARLHDIGKIGVPDAILNKLGPLTKEEWAVIRRHPSVAFEILGHTTFLKREAPLILHHHERHDGTGYPSGLAGEQIPLGARILNVADSLDAMISRRSYKEALSLPRAGMELRYCSGRQFDPVVVEATLDWLEETGDAVAAECAPL